MHEYRLDELASEISRLQRQVKSGEEFEAEHEIVSEINQLNRMMLADLVKEFNEISQKAKGESY